MSFQMRVLAAAVAVASCQVVYASHEVKAESLEEVEVRASKLIAPHSASMHEMDAKELESMLSATSDTASLLGGVAGLQLYQAGGVSSLPAIHGMADDRLRIKVDGMDLVSACANHMNPPLSYIGASNVGNATVFTGIVPVSVGGDSIGGAIQVESPVPEFAKEGQTLLKGQAAAFYRSNGDGQGGNLSATFASENVSLTYQGSTEKAEDYTAGDDFKPEGPAAAGRDSLDGDEVGSSMYKSTNQQLSLGARFDGNHLIQVKAAQQDIPYQGWPNQRMDMTGNDSDRGSVGYEGKFGWGVLEAQLYHEKTRHSMQFYDDKLFWYGGMGGVDGVPCTPSPTCAAGMPMDTEGKNSGAQVKGNIALTPTDLLRVGLEAQQYRMDDWWDPSGGMMMSPNVFWNIRDGERDRLALFAEWESKWSDEWLTLFGLRHEEVEMDTGNVQGYNAMYDPTSQAAFNAADHQHEDHNLDATLLARLTPSAMQTYEFGISRKNRSPNLYERYSWSKSGMSMEMVNLVGDGNGYVGNLELAPETAYTASVTADWHGEGHEHWGVAVTPFYTHIEDYIDAERCSGGVGMMAACSMGNLTATNDFVFLQYVNQRARIYGVDISGHLTLLESQGFGELAMNGAIGWLDGKNEKTGDNLYNIMPLNAKFALVHQLAGWTGRAEVEMVDKKDNVSAVRNEIETSGYGLFHLRGSYEWNQLRFDLGVENVLDKMYADPLGGAYTGQGNTMSGVGVPWGTPVPGMGRSIYAGVNVKF